jgi:hypothetical protein
MHYISGSEFVGYWKQYEWVLINTNYGSPDDSKGTGIFEFS